MIILDSSFLVAFAVETDTNHLKAVKIMDDIVREKYGRLCITDYIFDETVTVIFIKTKKLAKAVSVGNALKKSVEIIDVDKNSFEDAWNKFKRQKKTDFSFTDCTTLAVMEANEIKNIATFDEDFKMVKEINVIGVE
jgi:predicted nucleic acid-binding protein